MDLKFSKRNGTLIVRIVGEIDHHTCEYLRVAVERNFEKIRGKNMIFEMSGVDFMDSSGIGAVIGRYKLAKCMGGGVAVACPNERVKQIFHLSAMDKIIPCFPDLEKAICHLEGGK